MNERATTNNQNHNPLTIWTMTSGAAGMRSQVKGLAEAIARIRNAKISEKTIQLKPWLSWLPGHLNPFPFKSLTSTSSTLTPPWPDLLITSGRRSVAASIAIGRKSKNQTYRVHIQNPQTPLHHFDCVCSMAHDNLSAPNVLTTKTALHKLTNDDLEKAKRDWSEKLDLETFRQAKGPIIGVLLGGKTKKHGFDDLSLNNLINLIKSAISSAGAQILITPSGRTEPFVKKSLNSVFSSNPNVWLWNEQGDNPYHAILALSDHLCITSDSVSMISEALYTTKPVHIFDLSGISKRHQSFQTLLLEEKSIHKTGKTLDLSLKTSRSPIDETSKMADIICRRLENFAH